MDALGNIFHLNLLGYAHWFMSIRMSQMNYYAVSEYWARYATSIVAKYLDNVIVKTSTKFYNTTFSYYMIFTKADTNTSYDQVEKLTREFNIHYRYCIGSFIY